VTVVVDPSVLAEWVVPAGSAQTPVTIEAGGRVVKARLNSKTLRRAIAADCRAWCRPGYGDRAGPSCRRTCGRGRDRRPMPGTPMKLQRAGNFLFSPFGYVKMLCNDRND